MPEVIFNGPTGRLESRYQPSKDKTAPIAIILHPHPHPKFGGTMNNKIVYDLFYMFQERGFTTLRFNFRGVGRKANLIMVKANCQMQQLLLIGFKRFIRMPVVVGSLVSHLVPGLASSCSCVVQKSKALCRLHRSQIFMTSHFWHPARRLA